MKLYFEDYESFKMIEYICWDDNKKVLVTKDKDYALEFANDNPNVDQVMEVIYNDPLAYAERTSPSETNIIYDR